MEPITRLEAIARLTEIYQRIKHRDYWGLSRLAGDEDEHIEYFIVNTRYISPDALKEWSNERLGVQMSLPFFRVSNGANYAVFDTQEEVEGSFLL